MWSQEEMERVQGAVNAFGALSAGQALFPTRVLGDFTVLGAVSEWSEEGWGFAVCELDLPWPQQLPAGSPIFVSREDLVMAEGHPAGLTAGQQIEFRVFRSDSGVQAAEVTAPGGDAIRKPGYEKPWASHGKAKGKGWEGGLPAWQGGKGNLFAGGGKSNGWPSTPSAFAAPAVQRDILKTHQSGTVKAALSAWSSATGLPLGDAEPAATPTSVLAGIQTASMNLVNDQVFQRATPEEQAASLGIMQEALAQAEMAQVAMERAQAMIRGSKMA